jgi:hypothetical protein
MKLPGHERPIVDVTKLRGYSLSAAHPDGKHKARVFASVLGLAETDAEWLRERLLEAARQLECQLGRRTAHGQRYLIDFVLVRSSRSAKLRSVWIVRLGEDFPRLVTCYVL